MSAAEVLFHPNMSLVEADGIAREQGGRLVWRGGRIRLMKARLHADAAAAAAMSGQYVTAIGHIREAQREVAEVVFCAPR